MEKQSELKVDAEAFIKSEDLSSSEQEAPCFWKSIELRTTEVSSSDFLEILKRVGEKGFSWTVWFMEAGKGDICENTVIRLADVSVEDTKKKSRCRILVSSFYGFSCLIIPANREIVGLIKSVLENRGYDVKAEELYVSFYTELTSVDDERCSYDDSYPVHVVTCKTKEDAKAVLEKYFRSA